MREGRAALVTSVSCFKFMALYSVIQFVTVIRLYQLNANMSDFQYLWIDLFVILPLAVYMSRTGPCRQVSDTPPVQMCIHKCVLQEERIFAARTFGAEAPVSADERYKYASINVSF
jgi:cation-transporting ATPase 13A2